MEELIRAEKYPVSISTCIFGDYPFDTYAVSD